MLKPAAWFIFASFLLLSALTLTGYFTYTRYFNPSQVISQTALWGFAVLLFYLCFWAAAVYQKYKWSLRLILPGFLVLFFGYYALAVDRLLMPLLLLSAAAGFFTALRWRRAALLCGIMAAGGFAWLMTDSYWSRNVTAILVCALMALGLALYFILASKAGKKSA